MMKLFVETHSGPIFEVEVESFDPVQFDKDLNNQDLNTVVIGQLVRARIDVKGATPENIYLASKNA